MIRGGGDPDFIIRLADGLYAAISASWTDYGGAEAEGSGESLPLLELAGLRQMATVVQRWLSPESR